MSDGVQAEVHKGQLWKEKLQQGSPSSLRKKAARGLSKCPEEEDREGATQVLQNCSKENLLLIRFCANTHTREYMYILGIS